MNAFVCVQIDQEGLTLPERSLYLSKDEESVKVILRLDIVSPLQAPSTLHPLIIRFEPTSFFSSVILCFTQSASSPGSSPSCLPH